jgi:hypothetical protein
MAITMRTRNARLSAVYPRALSPRQPNHSASAAERIAFLTSARSAQRSTRPIGSEKEGANRIAFSHMLSSAHRLQVYLGHPRRNVSAIEHIERLVTKARQDERGNRSGEKQQCARVARLYLE